MSCPGPTSCPCGCHDGHGNPCTVPGGCGLTIAAPSMGLLERPENCAARPCSICKRLAHPIGADCKRLARDTDAAARLEARHNGWDPGDVTPDPRHDCPVRGTHLGQTCHRCHERMHAQLVELPELYALAAGEMALGTGGSGGRSTEPSIGLRVAALDLRSGTDVIDVLAAWDRRWSHHYGDHTTDWTTRSPHHTDPVGLTLVHLARRIDSKLRRACETYPDIERFSHDLNTLHGEARAAARTTGARSAQVDCPADSDTGICGAPLRIAGLNLDDVVYCRRCHTRWGMRRLLLVAAADSTATVWLPADDVALLLGIPRRTLFRWAKDGRCNREHGLFDVESVREAITTGTRAKRA